VGQGRHKRVDYIALGADLDAGRLAPGVIRNGEMSQMTEMAKCGQTNAEKNARMSKARNERMTLEQQIQPLEGRDIPTFFPAIGLSGISPFRTFVTFRHCE